MSTNEQQGRLSVAPEHDLASEEITACLNREHPGTMGVKLEHDHKTDEATHREYL